MSAEQNNTTTVESDPSAPAEQAPNLSTTETVQPDLPAKKKKKKVNKKQYVVDEKNACWVPKRMKAVDKTHHKIDKGYASGAINSSDCLKEGTHGSWPSRKQSSLLRLLQRLERLIMEWSAECYFQQIESC
jgi:hypothetical protein